MNDYYNLYNMQGYDPYKGMSDDEKMKIVCAKVIGTVVGVFIAMAVCALLFG